MITPGKSTPGPGAYDVESEAPSRLDRRRLWRARQAIDLEPLTEQRAARHEGDAGLRWKPVPASELRTVGAGGGGSSMASMAVTGLFDVSAASDADLLGDLAAGAARAPAPAAELPLKSFSVS